MMNTDMATPRVKEMPHGIYTGSSYPENPQNEVGREVRIRFLQESATYLDVQIKRHDLIARYIND